MDGRVEELQAKLSRLARETAEAHVALAAAKGALAGTPHYSSIEQAAHDLGREVSRLAQQRHMAELTALRLGQAKCPGCGAVCETQPKKRTARSADGPVELLEPAGYCSACRRAFFPSAGSDGV